MLSHFHVILLIRCWIERWRLRWQLLIQFCVPIVEGVPIERCIFDRSIVSRHHGIHVIAHELTGTRWRWSDGGRAHFRGNWIVNWWWLLVYAVVVATQCTAMARWRDFLFEFLATVGGSGLQMRTMCFVVVRWCCRFTWIVNTYVSTTGCVTGVGQVQRIRPGGRIDLVFFERVNAFRI